VVSVHRIVNTARVEIVFEREHIAFDCTGVDPNESVTGGDYHIVAKGLTNGVQTVAEGVTSRGLIGFRPQQCNGSVA